jgi:hypothetical protein
MVISTCFLFLIIFRSSSEARRGGISNCSDEYSKLAILSCIVHCRVCTAAKVMDRKHNLQIVSLHLFSVFIIFRPSSAARRGGMKSRDERCAKYAILFSIFHWRVDDASKVRMKWVAQTCLQFCTEVQICTDDLTLWYRISISEVNQHFLFPKMLHQKSLVGMVKIGVWVGNGNTKIDITYENKWQLQIWKICIMLIAWVSWLETVSKNTYVLCDPSAMHCIVTISQYRSLYTCNRCDSIKFACVCCFQ